MSSRGGSFFPPAVVVVVREEMLAAEAGGCQGHTQRRGLPLLVLLRLQYSPLSSHPLHARHTLTTTVCN